MLSANRLFFKNYMDVEISLFGLTKVYRNNINDY